MSVATRHHRLTERIAAAIFGARRLLLIGFAVVTAILSYSATHLRVDAGFNKMIPLDHPYMKVFTEYRQSFGGANRVVVALTPRHGDIFTPVFFDTLKRVTDDVFFIPGVDRATVTSLFTPNVRFIEVVEEGFAGGNVIPAGFAGTPQELETVRANVVKSGNVGRLVANDFRGALVRAELLEVDPGSGRKLDYRAVARQLEALRAKYTTPEMDVHIIGFVKAVGDIADGARSVIAFFGIAFLVTAALFYLYSDSLRLTALGLTCALVPVVWLLGILPLLGYGIDPLSILVPFLIFSIGVSHAVQMTNAWKLEVAQGRTPEMAARNAFLKLFVPGAVALATNALGFIVMLHIEIEIVREFAVAASLGVLLMIVTNKVLLPVMLSHLRLEQAAARRARTRGASTDPLWWMLSGVARRGPALAVLGVAVLLAGVGVWKARELRVGDVGTGLPELKQDARYNRDVKAITDRFSIGVDVLSVIAQTRGVAGACTDFALMDNIERFEFYLRQVDGVQSVLALPGFAKIINAGYNEGSLKWRSLSRVPEVLAQAVTPVDTGSGLLDPDCGAMQVMIFTRDHHADTLERIVRAVKHYAAHHDTDHIRFLLAGGNAGVMAATNEAVAASEKTMLASIFASVIALCWITFRSLAATLCIILPLALVSLLCNALMASLGIGVKVATLPVIALGVGVGVDYGIYLYERFQHALEMRGVSKREAFHDALRQRGTAAVFTAVTMSVGVGTWAFSDLKFQADMGILLAFMFLVNMLGAVLLLPALAAYLVPAKRPGNVGDGS
ncbi:MAG: efflux RND transporter permease subunit [Burkholderiales bacterium]|nr:efflux RND transporter permease subunit [Burkholderiales bacterium]